MKNCLIIFSLLLFSMPASAASPEQPEIPLHEDYNVEPVQQSGGYAQCANGVANGYACTGIDMLANLPLNEIGGGAGSDGWGWKDEQTSQYYAIVTRSNGTAFIDITTPTAPVYRGNVPSTEGIAPWRDVKVYKDHAYIVADNISTHGMQVFDMTRLRGAGVATSFTPDATYMGIGRAHNIAINETSGFAYIVGSDQCQGGLHMVDLVQPDSPVYAGCFDADGYTHDVQCVIYSGPDQNFRDSEICIGSNEDSITVVDVTDKNNPVQLSKGLYPGTGYTHQGWLDENHRYFYVGDELDELNFGFNARTIVFDLQSLTTPNYIGAYTSSTSVIDHNMYIVGDYIFQANYLGGLRVLRINDAATAGLTEAAFFDTHPNQDSKDFAGAWTVYPFFDNDVIIVVDINSGLFVLHNQLQQNAGVTLDGSISGEWVAEGLPDQGLTLTIGENASGRYLFYAWYTYLDGKPYWFAGNAFFEPGADSVTMPAILLEGLEFLTPTSELATRTVAGTVEVTVHACDEIHVNYDLGTLGSGELDMNRLLGIQGRECSGQAANTHNDDHEH